MTKSKSHLVPVKKVITRGNTTFETTVLVNPNKVKNAKHGGNVKVPVEQWANISSLADFEKCRKAIFANADPATKDALKNEFVDFMRRSGVNYHHCDTNVNVDYMRCMMKAKKMIQKGEFVADGSDKTRMESPKMKLSQADARKKVVEFTNKMKKDGRDKDIIKLCKDVGVQWKESDNPNVNRMRCLMELREMIEDGKDIPFIDVPKNPKYNEQKVKLAIEKMNKEDEEKAKAKADAKITIDNFMDKMKEAIDYAEANDWKIKQSKANPETFKLLKKGGVLYIDVITSGVNEGKINVRKGIMKKVGNICSTPKEVIEIIKNYDSEKAEEEKKKEDAKNAPIEVSHKYEDEYHTIDEKLAKIAKEMNSFYDYKENSTTRDYRDQVDHAFDIANNLPDEFKEEGLKIARRYSKKLADWYNKKHSIDSMMPSIMISGGGNFNVKKKQKQNEAWNKHYKLYDEIAGMVDKIKDVAHKKKEVKADDDGITALKNDLAEAEAFQDKMKEANKYYAKHKTMVGFGKISEQTCKKLDKIIEQQHLTKPFESWQLTNNNNKIKKLKAKIKEMESIKESVGKESEEFKTDLFEVIQNVEANRLQLKFPGVPDSETRTKLKKRGFKWSPKNKVWQRQLTDNAKYATKALIKELEGQD